MGDGGWNYFGEKCQKAHPYTKTCRIIRLAYVPWEAFSHYAGQRKKYDRTPMENIELSKITLQSLPRSSDHESWCNMLTVTAVGDINPQLNLHKYTQAVHPSTPLSGKWLFITVSWHYWVSRYITRYRYRRSNFRYRTTLVVRMPRPQSRPQLEIVAWDACNTNANSVVDKMFELCQWAQTEVCDIIGITEMWATIIGLPEWVIKTSQTGELKTVKI